MRQLSLGTNCLFFIVFQSIEHQMQAYLVYFLLFIKHSKNIKLIAMGENKNKII